MKWPNRNALEKDLIAKSDSMFLRRKDLARILHAHPNGKRVSRILKKAKAMHDFGTIYAVSDLAEAIWEEQK